MNRRKTRWHRYVYFVGAYIIVFVGIWLLLKYIWHGTTSDEIKLLIIFSFVSALILLVVINYLYQKKRKESSLIADEQNIGNTILYGPAMDERDLMINKSARWCGFGIFWFFYVFGFMGTWVWAKYQDYRSISVDTSVLPFFVFGAFILIFLVDSITTVILYRRGK